MMNRYATEASESIPKDIGKLFDQLYDKQVYNL